MQRGRVYLGLSALIAAVMFSDPAKGATVNMSHDLVSLGIATQNLLPDHPELDARPLIQAAAQYAQSHGVQLLTLDTGAYYLLSAQQSNAVLIFGGLSNMTVDFAGSTLYFTGPLLPNGIQLYQCSNFTLTNLQIDFLNPPYTHAQLTSVDPTNRLLHYQTLAGWPDPSTFNNVANPFGGAIEGLWAAIFRDGAIVPGTSRTLLTGPISGNTLTLAQNGTPWTQSDTLSTLLPGDTIVVTARGGGPPILVWESDSITLSNISIYGSPTWAVQLYATSNSTVQSVSVAPRPGTGLVGSNADGIHFVSVRQNNHIRNCYVARTMDDGLIMDSGWVATVVSQIGPRQIQVTRGGFLRFPNGTSVNFIDPVTTAEFSGATISSQSPADSPGPAWNGQVTLTFSSDLPALSAGTGMVFASSAMRGQGSTIENSTVEDTYGGRGIWLSGAEGVTVEGNTLRRTSLAGIAVAQDTEADPAPPAHDITIQNNTLDGDLGPQAAGGGAQCALGAIQVVSTNNQQFAFASSASNSAISILGNSIINSGRSGIWVGEVSGATIQGNSIAGWNLHPELGTWGIPAAFQSQVLNDYASPIVVRYSDGATEQSNSILAPVTIQTNPAGLQFAVDGGLAQTAPQTLNLSQGSHTIAVASTQGGGSGTQYVFTGWSDGGAASHSIEVASQSTYTATFKTQYQLTIAASPADAGIVTPATGAFYDAGATVQVTANSNSGFHFTSWTGQVASGNSASTTVSMTTARTLVANFSVGAAPLLSIVKSHAGRFTQGQNGATYTVTVGNAAAAGPTSGTVTVVETVPSGLTLVSMAGTGWTCPSGGNTCTRSDSLEAGASYPAITVTVNVAADATSPQANQVSVTGGGSPSASATDVTNVAATYQVGDVYPYTADTAGAFGDGSMNVTDLIQVLFAVNNVPGFRPTACSDRFDAMDLYPVDTSSSRGGDGALEIRDLIRELFRVNNLDTDRPVRSSRVGVCAGAAAQSLTGQTKTTRDLLTSRHASVSGRLILGNPERPGATEQRVPVYLEAYRNLERVAVTFALGDQHSQFHWIPLAALRPALVQTSQQGALALAWLDGVNVPEGGRILLGYVAGPIGATANLNFFGISASGVDDDREVTLEAMISRD